MSARRVVTRASRQRGTAGVTQQPPQQVTEEVAVGQQVAVTVGAVKIGGARGGEATKI